MFMNGGTDKHNMNRHKYTGFRKKKKKKVREEKKYVLFTCMELFYEQTDLSFPQFKVQSSIGLCVDP